MARQRKQDYQCRVVNEMVRIHLCKKSMAGWKGKREFFVQCDQNECQYVDSNRLPCPLTLSMFKAEIAEREEEAQQRRETGYY